ncbi:hypothetical protein GA0061103_5893 [Rhizobium multihospitium]|uniref:Uncharacterized protein n=1 Tax=Rhizobium multihospitium TaxID=410764 RepID=A0A1C3WP18_9HYPH|nr:hypothetical protein GA0061103_5893 [Rhizobium multihospitium]
MVVRSGTQTDVAKISMGYPDKVFALIDNVHSAFSAAKTIEQTEAAWDYFHVLEAYIERTWPHEPATMDTLRRLISSLSTFTMHVRQRMPSPYNGWRSDLGLLRSRVSPNVSENG